MAYLGLPYPCDECEHDTINADNLKRNNESKHEYVDTHAMYVSMLQQQLVYFNAIKKAIIKVLDTHSMNVNLPQQQLVYLNAIKKPSMKV